MLRQRRVRPRPLQVLDLKITEKNLLEIFKIKNPNETLYELMKLFFLIISENSYNNQTRTKYREFIQQNDTQGLI